ncbi:DUF4112 domain-containing protein [Sorangium sp. So ce1036]|uniref:DUF4112 domain-containing protein n=1 Tax=Sorangium sp. So ce1036 TaxID=3133328 RepID=UPI003EFD1E9B
MPVTPLTPPKTAAPEEEGLKRLRWLGHFLDNAIRVPVVGYRIGYDAVIGLIPGVGDLVGFGLSMYIVVAAMRYRLPASTLLRMVLNVGLEALIGMVPLLGDLFDAAFKANVRNLSLLDAHLASRSQGSPQPSDFRFYAGLLVAVAALLALAGLLLFALLRALQALLGA